MTYQDEFARRNARGAGTGERGASRPCEERSDAAIQSGERRTGLLRCARKVEQMAERESRHPELVSGPRAAGPEDGGKTDGILKRVQDDEGYVQDDENERAQDEGDYNSVSGEPVEPRLSEQRRPSESQTARSATSSGLTDQGDDTPSPTRAIRHDCR